MKANGFSLLELLLVLVCIAAIISWSMHHYQIRERRAQTSQIESDIKTLQRALDTYFHQTGCSQNGVFANESLDVDCDTQLTGDDVVCSRPPLVNKYITRIYKTDQTTADPSNKPIYQLRVIADLSSSGLSADQVAWYQQQLRAKSGASDSELEWDSLPTNTNVQPGDQLWILSASGAYFRAIQNQQGAGGVTPPQYSGSYCAN